MKFNLSDFTGDVAGKLRAAGDALRANPGSVLVIPAGTHLLHYDEAVQIREDIFAGKYGDNPQYIMFKPTYTPPVGLDLTGCHDVTVEAEGALLLVDGFMEPVRIKDASNVTLRGLTIDHVRKPFTKATISDLSVEDKYVILDFDLTTPPTDEMPAPRSTVYDPKNDRLTTMWHSWACPKEYLSPLRVKLYDRCAEWEKCAEIYFVNTFHSRPAILISHASDTLLEDVTVHSQPGMGIVGFKSENVTMRRLRVVPSEGFNMSTNTDATHFASCRGTILAEDCEFRGNGDDCINVHSYYFGISDIDGEYCTLATITPDGTHSAEKDFPSVGDELVLTESATLHESERFRVVESSLDEPCRVRLDREVPQGGYIFGNLADVAHLVFHRNKAANHLARSVLCKTRTALIEDNEFYGSTGTAVNISAESNFGEGIPVDGVVVRNNKFISCGEWGHGTINGAAAIAANVVADDETACGVHRNLAIADNEVICTGGYAKHGFSIRNTYNAVMRGNRFSGFEDEDIEVLYSDNIIIE